MSTAAPSPCRWRPTRTTFTTAAGQPTAPGNPASPLPDEGAPAPAGTPVRHGKFEFTVNAVDAPVRTVGDKPYLQKTAQGENILVHRTVTNTGNKPQSYFSSNQKMIDDRCREFGERHHGGNQRRRRHRHDVGCTTPHSRTAPRSRSAEPRDRSCLVSANTGVA
ncbi:DUF4352 domain-containing protein [Nocardia fluminea]|uniref:DUF4352 domain-containing protein n=1 Tax=Nocardia fluminea TaxID=134984 RepID=UPI0033C809EC